MLAQAPFLLFPPRIPSLPQWRLREYQEDRIRTTTGYMLKNNARLILSAPAEVSKFVKEAVLSALNDSSVKIRNAAANQSRDIERVPAAPRIDVGFD